MCYSNKISNRLSRQNFIYYFFHLLYFNFIFFIYMKYSTINRDVKSDLPIMLKVGSVEVGKNCLPN